MSKTMSSINRTMTKVLSNSTLDSTSSHIVFIWFEIIATCIAYSLGFFGNILSLIVFYYHKEFPKVSTGILFVLITFSNFVHLITLAIEFLTIFDVTIFQNVFFQCQLTYYIQNVSRAMSTYFMITVSLDRLIRSELPMRSKILCTRRNVFILTFIYLCIFCLFWSFFLYPFITQNPLTGNCNYEISQSYFYFVTYLHIPIRAVLVCFIPIIITLTANIRMLMNIRHSRNRVIDGPTTNINLSHSQRKQIRRMSIIDRMLYSMMIANASIFIITQIPFHLYSCIENSLPGIDTGTNQLIRPMLLIWSSLYFSIAFYFYCLTSHLFRQKVLQIIRRIFCCQTIMN